MKFLMALVSFLILSASYGSLKIKRDHDVSDLKQRMVESAKYVDVVLVNFRGSGLSWRDFKKTIKETMEHYRVVGINLNIIKSVELRLEKRFWDLLVNDLVGIDPAPGTLPYIASEQRGNRVDRETEEIFLAMSKLVPNSENTIFISVHRGLAYKSWYTRSGERVLLNKGIQGFSFPLYGLGDSLAKPIRGFTAIVPTVSAKTISHELGHKLINVSHEGKSACPQFNGTGIPGLMGYGNSHAIFSGRKGRFHKERLHLSPFVYTIRNGVKVQNDDYKEGGHYRDPVYEGLYLTPECP